MYRLATKRTGVNEWKKTRTWVFWDTTTRALVYSILNLRRSTSWTLLVTLEWIEFGCVHKLYPEESDCVPAVCRPKFVTENGLIVCQ